MPTRDSYSGVDVLVAIDIRAAADSRRLPRRSFTVTDSPPLPMFVSPTWLRRWSIRVGEFAIVQVVVQLILGVAGLLIIRTLPKHEYALFAVVTMMQTTGNLLADLGIATGVREIGGRDWNNRRRMGELLRTAVHMRWSLAAISLGVTIPLGLWMLRQNGAELSLAIAMCLVVATAIFPLLTSSIFLTILQLHAEYRRIQKIDLTHAFLRLVLIAAVALTRVHVVLFAAVGALINWSQLYWLRRLTRAQADMTAPISETVRRDLRLVSRRLGPNIVFFCFQGQITLLLLTWMGNPLGVADITALGRVAIVFTVGSAVFSNVLGPGFVRCRDSKQLLWLYVCLSGGTALLLLFAITLAALIPRPFLWLLGANYNGLERELVWVMTLGSVAQLTTVMWNLNSGRGWTRLHSVGLIPLIVGSQLIAATILNLERTQDVLLFSLVGAAVPLPLLLADAVVGLRSARRLSTALSATGNVASGECTAAAVLTGKVSAAS